MRDARPRTAALHLIALASFAVAQPLLDILARHPTFLVAHRLSPLHIWIAVAVIGWLVPVSAILIYRLALLAGPRAAHRAYLGLVAILAGLVLLPLTIRWFPSPPVGPVTVSVLGATGFTVALARGSWLRRVVSALSVGALVFPAVFLLTPSIQKLLAGNRAIAGGSANVQGELPVVLVVFDELPITSLMDESRQVDPIRYPHFAALQATSTWFRNCSTVAASTQLAVPAILTGRNPRFDAMPILMDHPQNVFTLLAGSHRVHSSEGLTNLHPDSADEALAVPVSLRRFFQDVSLIYAHMILPAAWATSLPAVHRTWSGFTEDRPAPGAAPDRKQQIDGLDSWQETFYSRLDRFRRFVATIGPEPNTLHLIHSPLPHVPWMYSPSGRSYASSSANFMPGIRPGSEVWEESPWPVIQGFQRHLLQVKLVDRLLGSLIGRLREQGLYDQALIIVTADHGASFWPGSSRRDAELTQNPADVLDVPLFIKRPGQTRPEILDRHVQTIDILPTLIALAGGTMPDPVDGRSVFDRTAPEAPRKRILSASGQWFEFDPDPDAKFLGLDRKLSIFGSRDQGEGLFRIGPQPELVGRPVDQIPGDVRSGLQIMLNPGLHQALSQLDASRVPTLLFGGVAQDAGAAAEAVGIAINGVVEAVVPTLGDGRPFLAILPERAFPPGPIKIQLYLVESTAAGARLLAQESPPVRFRMPAP